MLGCLLFVLEFDFLFKSISAHCVIGRTRYVISKMQSDSLMQSKTVWFGFIFFLEYFLYSNLKLKNTNIYWKYIILKPDILDIILHYEIFL